MMQKLLAAAGRPSLSQPCQAWHRTAPMRLQREEEIRLQDQVVSHLLRKQVAAIERLAISMIWITLLHPLAQSVKAPWRELQPARQWMLLKSYDNLLPIVSPICPWPQGSN